MQGDLKMDDLISVIVPIYNAEKYLKECLESILEQTYKNLEILLIDDGSTDNSSKIVERYKKVDDRIKAFMQENGGQSKARNLGIQNAKGNYLVFVDSDDIIGENHIINLYEALKETNSDIAMSLFTKSICDLTNCVNRNYEIISGNYMEMIRQLTQRNFPLMAPTCKIYSRKSLKNISFYEGIIYEDGLFFHEMLNNIDQVVLVDSVSYYYRTSENSTLTSKVSIKNFDVLKKNKLLYDFFKQNHPEGLNYFYKNALNLNDFVAVKCIQEKSVISKQLIKEIFEQNKWLAKSIGVRKYLYISMNSYKAFLFFLSKIYSTENFGKESFLKKMVRVISK